jgi:SSS family solute:Na+ symporter
MHSRFLKTYRRSSSLFTILFLCLAVALSAKSYATESPIETAKEDVTVQWAAQSIPAEIGSRAAPFIGMHIDSLLIAGGLNTQNGPTYLDSIWFAQQSNDTTPSLSWKKANTALPSPRGSGISASFAGGVVMIGGDSNAQKLTDVLIMSINSTNTDVELKSLPSLPISMLNGSAVFVDNTLYVLARKTDETQTARLYSLNLDNINAIPLPTKTEAASKANINMWKEVPIAPNAELIVSQNDGRKNALFAIINTSTQSTAINTDTVSSSLTSQLWQYQADNLQAPWRQLDSPSEQVFDASRSHSAVTIGQSHFLLFSRTQNIPDVRGYNTITGAWAHYKNRATTSQNVLARNQVPQQSALQAIPWGNDIVVLQTGQHSSQDSDIWIATMVRAGSTFGWQNMSVLIIYLLAMVMIGVYFVFRNKSVDDYFRGGQHIPWWANACSMYATMLSSLTFVGIPAIVYRTDWLYWMGIWTILAVTPVAAYVAMPFFRKIDATSAYEFLSLRFNMSVRLFASGLFTLFHVSRMGIVMALTALALGAVTPFEVWQCVLIIGVLSLIYCTLGGIEAVIWTDTIQTIVLLLGAILCFVFIVNGVDGGISEIFRSGVENDKFRMVDLDFSMDSFTKLSLLVIVLGGIGQNLSTYTADQSIVQRFMTTKDVASARKSIWTNGIMAPLASALFFAIGTGLFVFYQYNPERLDPTNQIDQIFPSFISTELPIGIAGLIIAGIFAAAQSTVSTSMNSMATTVVTDFMRPFNVCKNERAYLNAARAVTLVAGILGTLVGLLFISPEIRSLMEEYFKVVGMFMGALGGLFILGVVSTRANANGAIIGLLFGVCTMVMCWIFELTDGYLFGTIGIVSSILVGYLASVLFKNGPQKELNGLTIHTIK